MASNKNTIIDPDFFQAADWIELKNTISQSISLDGYYLTDDRQNLKKWRFPADANIPANSHELFWADGQNSGRHTNFKLNASGEWIALIRPNGTIADSLFFKELPTDLSYGRDPAFVDKIGYISRPTPNEVNDEQILASNRQSAEPVFSLPSGVYDGGTTVSITKSAQAIVHYTLDGSIPTEQSNPYSSPFVLNQNTIIRAMAIEDGLLRSDVVTRSYIIDFSSELPVVSLVTQPDYLWDGTDGIYVDEEISKRKDWQRSAVLELFEPQSMSGFSISGDMRLFGRSAIYIPQKSLSFFPDTPLNYPLFEDHPVNSFSSFILRSSSDDWDDTMFADGFMQTLIAQDFKLDVQAFRPSVLFLNGEYWGIHNIREKYNEDYLARHHGVDPQNLDLLYVDYRHDDITVVAGDADGYYDLIDYIQNTDLSRPANYDHVKSIFDIENYIDYIIAEAYLANVSWAHNMRIWRPKSPGGKWKWLIFDLDRCMKESSDRTLGEIFDQSDIFSHLVANADFRQQFVYRALYHMNNTFQPDNILALLSQFEMSIENEMPRHIEKWAGKCGNSVCGISSMAEWQDNIETLERFASARPQYFLQELNRLFDLGNTVDVNLAVSPVGYGKIKVNDQLDVTDQFNGVFQEGTRLQLTARANPGFFFEAWKVLGEESIQLVPQGAEWSYRDVRQAPDAAWTQLNFDDSAWLRGRAQLGYGDGDEVTTIGYGGDDNDKNITAWFRHKFVVNELSGIDGLVLQLLRDDGAVVYINGVEVLRSNMPDGLVTADTYADGSTSNENEFREFPLSKDVLQTGDNIVAVEVHQTSSSSSDLSFDCAIVAEHPDSGGEVISEEAEFTLTLDQDVNLVAVFQKDIRHVMPTTIMSDKTLTKDFSPYLVTEDVIVSPQATLKISAGVDILFAEGTSLSINGRLLVDGISNDRVRMSPIVSEERWGGLSFSNTTALSSLHFLEINGATSPGSESWQSAAISSQNAQLELVFVDILNVHDPFSANGGTITMKNCRLDGSFANDDLLHIISANALIENCELWGDGEVDFDYVDDSIIRNNTIRISSSNSNQDAFDLGSSKNVLIEGNWILNATDKGVSIGENSTAIIQRNVIVSCNSGVAVKDNSQVEVLNNTFFRNRYAINAYEKNLGSGGGTAYAVNNIFAASIDTDLNIDSKSTINATFSLSTATVLPGNGNIMGDPSFVDPANVDFHIYANSPARDAGDPQMPNDPDGTRSDIGAFYYDTSLKKVPVTLNEICANNVSVIADPAGEFDDWIELYNTGPEPFDVRGLYLTDDESQITKWRIVSSQANETLLQPGGFLLVWMDGDAGQDGLHASFKLSADGEFVGLYYVYAGDTTQIDAYRYGRQAVNTSMSRLPDGEGPWVVVNSPTPWRKNSLDTTVGKGNLPDDYELLQNYPNPFNPQTVIRVALPAPSFIRLVVTDVLGRHVRTLYNGEKPAGRHNLVWDGKNDLNRQVSAGVYFYSIETDIGFRDVKKMMFLK